MLLKELQVDITCSSDMEFLDNDRTRMPAWLIRLACAAHTGAASLAECRDLCKWFGSKRRRATIHQWYQAYADYYEQEFTAEPDRVAAMKRRSSSKTNRRRSSTRRLVLIRKSCSSDYSNT